MISLFLSFLSGLAASSSGRALHEAADEGKANRRVERENPWRNWLNLKAAVESPLNWSSSSNRKWLQRLTISPFWRGAEQFNSLDRGESEQVSFLTPSFPQGLKPTFIFSNLRHD
jgi:hypothetical protein